MAITQTLSVKLLFVGEEPSPTALSKGWTWANGRLAAKQLFDALKANGINPTNCEFCNWFGENPKREMTKQWKGQVVAMGRKVQKALSDHSINHIPIVHPAARGTIRKKENYIKHIKEMLT